MSARTVDLLLPSGLTADRPASADVPSGALYPSTDDQVIYRNNNAGTAWETWLEVADTTGLLDAEQVRDTIAAMLTQGANITLTNNDAGDTLTIAAAGGASTADSDQLALAKMYAGFATRLVTPCRIAFAGSSTTAGTNATTAANRYVNRLVAAMQAAYPSGGAEAAVIASDSATWGTLSTAAGIHGYNAGDSGTSSSDYLTSGEQAAIGALNPRAVFHMIGASDFSTDVLPATYKSNVAAAIAGINAATSGPVVHVLIHTYQRWDDTGAHPWADYGTALRELAEADPDDIVFIDLSDDYALLGVPSTDPLGLIESDNLHQNDAGHALMADLIRRAIGLHGTGRTSLSGVFTLEASQDTGDIPSNTPVGTLIVQKLT